MRLPASPAPAARRSQAARWALLVVLLVTTFVPSLSSRLAPPAAAAPIVKMPFASGQSWYISQGYNTNPTSGGSHYNCDPNTLKDAPSQTRSCSRYWQYKYSFDFTKSEGSTAGQTVYSPVTGMIRWIDQAYGGMSIDIGSGHAYAFFHVTLAAGLAANQQVTQGQVLGTVAPPGEGGNGGYPHIHVTLWETTDGGNWSRVAVPFTGSYAMDGYDFPAMSSTTWNQYRTRVVTSTNGGGTTAVPLPGRPVNASPADGTTGTSSTPTLRWNPSTDAVDYEVWIDGAARSGWITGTSWTTPSLAEGRHTWQVRARNSAGTSSLSSTWSFSVGGVSAGSIDNGAMIGTGRYRVIGTREGGYVDGPLGPGGVPGTTSSGHKIVENDHFVSLPACVPTNCPGLTGGQVSTSSGYEYYGQYVTNCGSNCYVKVINPATNRCDVVPILDKGPWFRIDNWWDTESLRNINRNPNNVNKLAQGYAAAAAARSKIDVGYGVDQYGYGRTNVLGSDGTYRPTGQANSVDIADGTWLEIGFPWDPGPQTVVLEMLWQTGESRTAAVAACDGPTVPVKVSLSKASGPASTSLTVTGSGYQAGEQVRVFLDSSKTTPLASATASSSGWVSASIVVPATYGGAHRIHAVGRTSGKRNAATFTVTPTATISPSSGSSGLLTTVTVAGFGQNETVSLLWPGRVTPSGQATTDSLGNGRFTVRTPRSYGQQLGRLTGATSRLTSSVTYTVIQRVRVSPSSGASGDSIVAYGLGWPSNTTITFRWNSTTGTILCSATTDRSGYAECRFRVPSGSASYTTSIIGLGGGLKASASFTKTGLSASSLADGETVTPAGSPVVGDPTASVTPTETPIGSPVVEESPTVEPVPTETATVEPTATETPPPTETPTPEATPREVVMTASSDASVTLARPEEPQPAEQVGTLPVGGADTAVAYLTFDVAGVAPGTVVDATLVLTGAVGGAGGPVGAVAGYRTDEASVTYLTAPTQDVPPAGTVDGQVSRVGPVQAGQVVTIDVTATVQADGTVTFVLLGDEVGYAVSSRESSSPPTLILHVIDPT